MPMPSGWKGSDGRSRAEVVLWLTNQGGEVHDSTGLIVGRMKRELGKGRALSQLLADMERDGMIERELAGRRTLRIKLLDGWGLADDLSRQPVYQRPAATPAVAAEPELEPAAVDYDELAAVLLARVVKQAHAKPSSGADLIRLQEQVDRLSGDLSESRDQVARWMAEAEEQRQQADRMRENIVQLQAAIEKPAKRSEVKLRDALDPKDRKLLDRLMREVPAG